jgi:hypothetical protein
MAFTRTPLGPSCTATGHPQRAGQTHEVDARPVEVHADVDVVGGREALEGMGALLEDAVRAVVEDDVDDGQRFVRRRPQGLAGVHGAAIADQGHHRAVAERQLHAEGGREPPADPATA